MADPIREALERLVTAYDTNEGLPIQEWLQIARAALAAEPPAPAPAADGEREEREELAQWLDGEARSCAAQFHDRITRAAALLRQPAPAPVPVPVAERPWERPGWCDAVGRCWWFAPAEAIPCGFRCAGWSLYAPDPADEDTHCLPHWAIAIPQPPQGGEVKP